MYFLFLALVSVSEEVRSRCHLKHRISQYMMSESPSSDSLNADIGQMSTTPGGSSNSSAGSGQSIPSTPAPPAPPSLPNQLNNTLPMAKPPPRREKSWDLLDQSAMNTARGMQKGNTHLTQAQVFASFNCCEKVVRILLLSRKYEGFFFINKIHQVAPNYIGTVCNDILNI